MIAYDDTGYAAEKPFRPDSWQSNFPDMPGGVQITHRALPPGFLIVQNYLDPAVCQKLIAECEQLPGIKQGVSKGEADISSVMDKQRVSETVDIFKLQTNVVDIVKDAYANVIAPHFGADLEWFERPEVLRYHPGGEYKPHADAENWFAGEKQWKRVIDRDISILLYLNEGFQGGEIAFPNFGMQLPPRTGLLIAFPSDARYLHTARPLVSGKRYALVSWAAVKGSPRVLEAPGDIYRL